jgi:hypothetical protein
LRVDAVAAHESQCPECAGLLRLTFNMVSPEPPIASVLERPPAVFRSPAHNARRRPRGFEPADQEFRSPR